MNMKMKNMKTLLQAMMICCAAFFFAACDSEQEIIPTKLYDDLLFDFPQGRTEEDHELQKIQEAYGIYPIYKDVTYEMLNRAWVNLYPNMYIESTPIQEHHLPIYTSFLKEHIFDNFQAGKYNDLLPRYIFMVNDMHRVDNKVAKPHMFTKLDGVDFWAISFESENIEHLYSEDLKKCRIVIVYEIICRAMKKGLIMEPENFTQGIDYKTIVYDHPDPNSIYNFMNRGFVEWIPEDFSRSGLPVTMNNLPILSQPNQDFLAYVREILNTTPRTFDAKYGTYKKVMERYKMVIDSFNASGIDLNKLATGPEK